MGEMVPAIGGGQLDYRLAPSFAHHVAAQPRARAHLGASWATSDESICYRAMDGLQAIRSGSAADDNKLRYHGGISAAAKLLGQLEFNEPDDQSSMFSWRDGAAVAAHETPTTRLIAAIYSGLAS